MTMGIASLVFIPLLAIALAHLGWAFGLTWPIRDEALLARTVTGFAGRQRMPARPLSLLVSVAVFVAGMVALSLADDQAGGLGLSLLGLAIAAVFLARGLVGYSARWARLTPEEPFRSLDRKVYSPLCLALGAGFVVLVMLRLL